MMQHTQTHRNSRYSIVAKHQQGRDTRSSTRAQTKGGKSTKSACEEPVINNQLFIQTSHHSSSGGLVSPISLSSPKKHYAYSSSSSEEEEDDDDDDNELILISPNKKSRRLSVADLCNPTNAPPICNDASFIYNLTKDEFEALEGFGRFRHTPSVFSDSLKDLASHAQRY
jgi:hypothetical protein